MILPKSIIFNGKPLTRCGYDEGECYHGNRTEENNKECVNYCNIIWCKECFPEAPPDINIQPKDPAHPLYDDDFKLNGLL